jgi:hypothetical protein
MEEDAPSLSTSASFTQLCFELALFPRTFEDAPRLETVGDDVRPRAHACFEDAPRLETVGDDVRPRARATFDDANRLETMGGEFRTGGNYNVEGQTSLQPASFVASISIVLVVPMSIVLLVSMSIVLLASMSIVLVASISIMLVRFAIGDAI